MDLDLTPEQQAFLTLVEQFARDEVLPCAATIDEQDAFPRDLIARAGALGLMGVTVPTAHGGAGRDQVTYALALEAIARASATVAVILAVNNSLLVTPLLAFASDDQKARWLRPLASGDALGAFALSEEQAGTDAFNQQTRVTPDGCGYRLNGRKVWVANAVAADVAIVFAASHSDARRRGISAFLIPLDAEGIVRSARNDSLGVRGLGCMDVDLQDVYVDASQVIGAPEDGLNVARCALENGRIAVAAQALGVGQAALDEAVQHARTRQTFGQPIGRYQAIQWMLADTATELDAARLLTHKAAAMADLHVEDRVMLEAAMAKLYASEAAHRAADRAMQILASAGYRRGSRVERLFRDARAIEIYQGTSEVQRMIIAEEILGS
ncbi:MAG: acyl-CoA dehydrogenase [Luteitalea sp.]|nr:acyl-CoA dehydrogenase [Luteitalea sp.]